MSNQNINSQRVRVDFENATSTYDAAAIVQHAICDRTLERLEMLKLQPDRILDIGTGTGRSCKGLNQRFPKSKIIATDIALRMLQHCQKNTTPAPPQSFVCNAAEHLPFADKSFDLIFSTSTFQWSSDLNQVLIECKRVLSEQGVLIFSTFGPDTLFELRNCWAQVDHKNHVHTFIDMHHIGDALLANQYNDPVMDMEMITIEYQSLRQLLQDLKDTGSRSKFSSNTALGLLGKQKYQQLEEEYESFRQENDMLPASYEVIYGYARKATQKNEARGQEISIPLSEIKK